MTHTSALSLYKRQLARFTSVQLTARQMHAEIAKGGYDEAVDATDGSLGPKGALRKKWLAKNRPFARNIARAKLAVKPLPIGIITGRVHSGFKLNDRSSAKRSEWWIENSAPHSKYILFDAGTRKMRGRGFQEYTRKRFKARNKAFVDAIRQKQGQP